MNLKFLYVFIKFTQPKRPVSSISWKHENGFISLLHLGAQKIITLNFKCLRLPEVRQNCGYISQCSKSFF